MICLLLDCQWRRRFFDFVWYTNPECIRDSEHRFHHRRTLASHAVRASQVLVAGTSGNLPADRSGSKPHPDSGSRSKRSSRSKRPSRSKWRRRSRFTGYFSPSLGRSAGRQPALLCRDECWTSVLFRNSGVTCTFKNNLSRFHVRDSVLVCGDVDAFFKQILIKTNQCSLLNVIAQKLQMGIYCSSWWSRKCWKI